MLIAFQQKLQHTSNQHLKVLIQGEQVTNVTDEKLLGVQVDNNLSWKQQIQKVRKTVVTNCRYLGVFESTSPLKLAIYPISCLLNRTWSTVVQYGASAAKETKAL